MVINMREEYDVRKLNPRKNPYAGKLKQQITMNMNITTIQYFKNMSSESGIPYQTLINLYLDDCVKQGKKIEFVLSLYLFNSIIKTVMRNNSRGRLFYEHYEVLLHKRIRNSLLFRITQYSFLSSSI